MTTRTPEVPSVEERQDGRTRRSPSSVQLGVLGVVVFLGIVEILPLTGLTNERYLPPASQMGKALWQLAVTSSFWGSVGNTLITWAVGLTVASSAAVALGLVIGLVPVLRAATASTIEFLRPIPAVALIPLAVLTFGTGRESTLMLVIYATFWQVLIQVLAGVQDVDPVARDTARSYRFSRSTTVLRVVWPTTVPYAVTGLRLGANVALILTITGELIIGTPGLGRELSLAQQSAQYPTMYAVVIVTGFLGAALNVLTRRVERRALHWHQSVRGEMSA
jgi:ABC-type nitrate/sulfonate/bicarbonate transport system permease component